MLQHKLPLQIMKNSSARADEECLYTVDNSGQAHSTNADPICYSDSGNWSAMEAQYLTKGIAELRFSRFPQGHLKGTQESNFHFLIFSWIQAYLKHHTPSFSRSSASIRRKCHLLLTNLKLLMICRQHSLSNAALNDDVFKYALEYYSVETETWNFINAVHSSVVGA